MRIIKAVSDPQMMVLNRVTCSALWMNWLPYYIDITQNDYALVKKFQTILSYILDTHFNNYVVSNCSDCEKLRMQESDGGAWVADRILIISGQG